MPDFVHLHNHSHYSLLDGLPKVEGIVARAKELGMKAVALTDHGVLYGAIEFYQKATAAGIKPIVGVEAYLTPLSRHDRTPGEKPYHLLLLAKNRTGYQNLMKLTTLAHLEGYYWKPRLDWELLERYHDGIIATSTCLNGQVPRAIRAGRLDEARGLIERSVKVFGPDNFYLELQARPSLPAQGAVNDALKQFSRELGVPLVATNDVHYLTRLDAEAQDILLCIQTKRLVSDQNRMNYLGEDYSFKTAEEMAEYFHDVPEAITNTVRIAEACNLELEFGKISLPHFVVPDGKTPDQYLRELCVEGARRRYGLLHAELPTATRERVDYELGVIANTGFAPYFLIVADFINWAKSNRIVVGPGRGSAAGSIVAYLTNITNIDPLKYELLFERFLNPERVTMPDIDIDFADTRRNEVIRYVEEKYGHDHVSQIITFGTMAARAAVRDVGRVLGMAYGFCDQIAKLIPMFTTIEKAIETVPDLQALYQSDPEAARLLDSARKLEGVARHASTHACGVLITKEQIDQHVPLQYASPDDKTLISQYSLHPIEDLGLLKMDFLGLKNLTVIENTLRIVAKTRNTKVDIDQIPLDDPKTFALFRQARTTGVFQLESAGLKRYLAQLKPTTIEDIIAMVALYRPGPMELIPDFIDRKQGRKEISYVHPKLAPILEKTYGVAIYQEQVMQIARDLAGFTLGEADVLRKAMGKKIKSLLVELKSKFVEGCVAHDIDRSTAERIFAFIEPFAGYGFNRAHAACYALIAYETAYLKAHFPAEFMAALLTSDQTDIDRVAIEVEECVNLGVPVLPPDVKESFGTFGVVSVDGKPTIRFGLAAIKNVGDQVAESIIEERKANGPFKSLEDFLLRTGGRDLNKKALESLIKSGSLDQFGERATLLKNLDRLGAFAREALKQSISRQTSLFANLPVISAPRLKLEPAEAAPAEVKLAWEKELLGLYLSSHPYRPFERYLAEVATPVGALGRGNANALVTTAGVVTAAQRKNTRAGEPMLFVKLEDTTGSIELLVFPRTLKETPDVWQEGSVAAIAGRMSDKDGAAKLLVDSARTVRLEDIETKPATAVVPRPGSGRRPFPNGTNEPSPSAPRTNGFYITVPPSANKSTLAAIKETLAAHPGDSRVYLILTANQPPKTVATSLSVAPSDSLATRIRLLVGTSAVTVKQ